MRGTKVKEGFMLSYMKNAQNETKKKYIYTQLIID